MTDKREYGSTPQSLFRGGGTSVVAEVVMGEDGEECDSYDAPLEQSLSS